VYVNLSQQERLHIVPVWTQYDARSKEIIKTYSAHPGIYEENNGYVIQLYFAYNNRHGAEQHFLYSLKVTLVQRRELRGPWPSFRLCGHKQLESRYWIQKVYFINKNCMYPHSSETVRELSFSELIKIASSGSLDVANGKYRRFGKHQTHVTYHTSLNYHHWYNQFKYGFFYVCRNFVSMETKLSHNSTPKWKQ
jgi:hypothetical protein